jgi:hypothetical protein
MRGILNFREPVGLGKIDAEAGRLAGEHSIPCPTMRAALFRPSVRSKMGPFRQQRDGVLAMNRTWPNGARLPNKIWDFRGTYQTTVVIGLALWAATNAFGQERTSTPAAGKSPGGRKSLAGLVEPSGKGERPRGRVGKLPEEPALPIDFLTAEEVQRLGPISFASLGVPLRQTLRNLSQTLRLAIVIDRRLDPDQVLDLDLMNVPIADALQRIASLAGGGASLLGPVAYIGPEKTAKQLRTVSALRTQEARRLPKARQTAALLPRPLAWHALATPEEIVQRLGDEADVEILGIERLPHDLLAATDLPAMPWVDRMTLVAAECGLAFQFTRGGRAVELVPLGNDARLERTYPAGREAAATVAQWKAMAPQAEISTSAGRIVVRATVEDHERLSPPKTAQGGSGTGQQVYTLALEGMPLEQFLAQLEQKLALKIEFDEGALAAAGVKMNTPVNVDVKNASLDDLLRGALAPLGLGFERQDKSVKLTTKRP